MQFPWRRPGEQTSGITRFMENRMPRLQTPIFLAREQRDADDLVEQLRAVRIDAEIGEVIVGKDRPGWQVLVGSSDAERARSIATVLEVQRYGDWETRDRTESHWGVMEDESALRDPTEIYSAQSVVQAHLLKNLLADQGILAIVTNQLLHGGAGIDLVGMPTAAKVVVAAEDAAAAREFALEFDERTRGQAMIAAEETIDQHVSPWPTCPECGAKRTTRCPICQTSGTNFAEADRGFLSELAATAGTEPESCSCSGSCSSHSVAEPHGHCDPDAGTGGEEAETMLMCSVCDEPFKPAHPKHCEWCGHEFEDGYVVERIVDTDEISGRAIAVVGALGVLLLGGMAYFLIILGG